MTRPWSASGTVDRSRERPGTPWSEEHRMTGLDPSRPAADTSGVVRGSDRSPTARPGWVVFAGSMMILLGVFQAVEGLVAIVDESFYRVSSAGLVVQVDYTVWGWVHVFLGALIGVCGVGVLAGNRAARLVGVFLAGLSALANLAFLEAHPVWGLLVI